mmetsp:Transcript_33051/g.53450  ORF Transcript_33051/g.53450 Transcript_33051/m.53450 type:complete len:407 (+) Transcript_33051:22-1242(+)
MAGRGQGGRGRGGRRGMDLIRPQPLVELGRNMDVEIDLKTGLLLSVKPKKKRVPVLSKASTPTKRPLDPIIEEEDLEEEVDAILDELTFEELFRSLNTEELLQDGNFKKISYYLKRAKEKALEVSTPVSQDSGSDIVGMFSAVSTPPVSDDNSSDVVGKLFSAVSDIRSDLNTLLKGQDEFPARQHATNNMRFSKLPPGSYAMAAARSLVKNPESRPFGEQPKSKLCFGANIYESCLVFENVVQQPAQEQANTYFLDLINDRLAGRVKPLTPGDITCVTEKDGAYSVFFNPDFRGVEGILENAFCFSQKMENQEAVYVSPLLSPEELAFQRKARSFALDACKEVHTGKEWWRKIKIYSVGFKLKIKVFMEGREGSRSVFLNMRGMDSPTDPSFKTRVLDIVSKVKF